ncbi:MAG: metallophosphoesterase [Verrucomicrobia bacterium]|nr:metallophosphoesterase [Verrucomicrobiota bacterium]
MRFASGDSVLVFAECVVTMPARFDPTMQADALKSPRTRIERDAEGFGLSGILRLTSAGLKSRFLSAILLVGALAPGARADWTFAIMGDTRGLHDTTTGISEYLNTIAFKIAEKRPDFVLCDGDQVNGNATNGLASLTYAQQFDNWKTAMNPVYALNIPVYTVRGNHENHADEGPPLLDLKQAYYDALGSLMPTNGPNNSIFDDQRGYTYSFTTNNATFMVVDQYFYPVSPTTGGYHSIDQTWLNQQLQQADTPYKIVMAHEPVYIDHFYGTDSTGMANRAEFWDSLGTNGASLYICGHTHNLSVSLAPDDAGNGIYQLLSGNGGAEPDTVPPVTEAGMSILYTNTTHYGFALATVGAEKMTIDYYLLNRAGDSWSKASYTTTIQAVPEPSSVLLLAAGLLGLVCRRARRRAASRKSVT